MQISLIVACAENQVIGRNNQLIWHLPNDLKRFRQLTTGHAVIMGRKTHESIGKPLPNRVNLVVSRNAEYTSPGTTSCTHLEQALQLCQHSGEKEVFVIGGEQLYKLALPLVDTIYLTLVHGNPEGDAHFPVLPPEEWQEAQRESFSADEKHLFAFSFILYKRIR
jgi:dihydrofolate reductase